MMNNKLIKLAVQSLISGAAYMTGSMIAKKAMNGEFIAAVNGIDKKKVNKKEFETQ